MFDRCLQNLDDTLLNPLPLPARQTIASVLGMDIGQVQDFRCIQVADARDRLLVQQRDFDFATTLAKPLM